MKRSNWSNQPWMLITQGDLDIEWQQCSEEGKSLLALQAEFEALKAADLTVEDNQRRAEEFLDATVSLPVLPSFGRHEPSDLDGIRAVRPPATVEVPAPAQSRLADKALGGWLGRCAGCLLGKPVEGRRSWQIEKYLTAQGRWPLDRYFSAEADPEVARDCGFHTGWKALYEEGIDGMVEDDDTNYTATGLAIVKQFGHDFTPANVAQFWLANIPMFHVCTAERIAYRNLAMSVPPPASGSFRNVYREWIGAQIRADFFGYASPGLPERAAEWAWRDACISHVKNGIYGEMWVAAMLASAYGLDDVEAVIRAGLEQIPATSRLAAAIDGIIALRRDGRSYDEAIADIRTRWSEDRGHDWCHTISNAEIVAAALLWGDRDFETTICRAVMPGFDTDCNGATAGSVLGLLLGASKLPGKWVEPLNDTLQTGVTGYHSVLISRMARETLEIANLTTKA